MFAQDRGGVPARSDLTILLYHGVYDGRRNGIVNSNGKHIDAAEFRRQIAAVRSRCLVLSMDEVAALALAGEPWPEKAVAVTFDDGFANNRTIAADILDELGAPATFYVCPGMIGGREMFWVDRLEDCFNRTERTAVSLTLDGELRRFDLTTTAQRSGALDVVKSVCKRSPETETAAILDAVAVATGVTPSCDAWPHYAPMTWRQVRELADNPLFIVGGHTMHHTILTARPIERARCDMHVCQKLLEYNLGAPVRHFSYPEGQPNHYDEAVIDALRAEGVVCSPSAVHGFNPPGSDLFHLKRVMVGLNGTPFPFDAVSDW